jgi:hypothetical protein
VIEEALDDEEAVALVGGPPVGHAASVRDALAARAICARARSVFGSRHSSNAEVCSSCPSGYVAGDALDVNQRS